VFLTPADLGRPLTIAIGFYSTVWSVLYLLWVARARSALRSIGVVPPSSWRVAIPLQATLAAVAKHRAHLPGGGVRLYSVGIAIRWGMTPVLLVFLLVMYVHARRA